MLLAAFFDVAHLRARLVERRGDGERRAGARGIIHRRQKLADRLDTELRAPFVRARRRQFQRRHVTDTARRVPGEESERRRPRGGPRNVSREREQHAARRMLLLDLRGKRFRGEADRVRDLGTTRDGQ